MHVLNNHKEKIEKDNNLFIIELLIKKKILLIKKYIKVYKLQKRKKINKIHMEQSNIMHKVIHLHFLQSCHLLFPLLTLFFNDNIYIYN